MTKPNKIKTFRKSQKWTVKELAEKLDVSPRTVESWEQGRRNPSGPVLKLLESL